MEARPEIIQPDKLKDVLLSKTAKETGIHIDIVEKVISFQFKDARDATKKYNEVEISGFGKFYISKNKVKKRMAKIQRAIDNVQNGLTSGKLSAKQMEKYNKMLEDSVEIMNYLKTKL